MLRISDFFSTFARILCVNTKTMNMKKIFSLMAVMALSMSLSAQLAWDTEFTKNDFNNAQTVISKTENVTWPLTGGLQVGKVGIFADYNDECVIALPQTGIAEELHFAWHGASGGNVYVYQSADHNNWSQIFTAAGNADVTATDVVVPLATTTRYIKFAATGRLVVATFRRIKVTELKSLSAGTDEWPFGTAMVDDADGVKSVTVNWTNIVAEVSSTDPHFSASLTTVGQKNLINQTTQLNIIYSHSEAGKHSGEIVIAGEGKEVRIAVSGETKKYDQTLTWIQTLGECVTTDKLTLNAFTSSDMPVVYESSDSTVAYVQEGVVQIVCAGEVTLTATQPGNYKYNATEPIAKSLVIRKADPMIGVTVEDLTYGQPLSAAVINETLGQVAGSFAWQEIDVESILDAGDYALTLLFTPDDACIYNTRKLQVPLHVNKAVQTIVWEDQQTELTVGTPVPSTAVLSSGLPVTYAYTECLLSIEDGIIVPENEGEVTVVAYHPGNTNYQPTMVIMTVFTIEAKPGVTTEVDQLSADQQRAARKFLHAGQVYMNYAGRVYDAQGKLIADF